MTCLIEEALEAQETLYMRMAFDAEALGTKGIELRNVLVAWADERRTTLERFRGSGNTYKQPETSKGKT